MSSRWYNLVVVVFWLVTMGWLLAEHVVPPLLRGDPPTFARITADVEPEVIQPKPVRWRMLLNDRTVGKAIGTTHKDSENITRMENLVEIEDLPVREIAPRWMAPLIKMMEAEEAQLTFTAKSLFTIDPLGRLVSFRTGIGGRGLSEAVTVEGLVREKVLEVTIRSGELTRTQEVSLAQDALVVNALAPHERLPGLALGQKWSVPVFSPFHPPTQPMELLYARVERQEPFPYHGQIVPAHIVVYRSDPRARTDNVRGRTWVDEDGIVLQQELILAQSRLVFLRLPESTDAPLEEEASQGSSGAGAAATGAPSSPPSREPPP